ncbi:hypothetical protein QSE00_22830 [Arenibacter sp. M-2]|uniref:hypothetical protein n=1 Tax=Arenibacter sp. M-2 TaxID=3053612 RepID=UPI002570A890|nr:hypothetical protein [Arenibacter sp. M-2]MDL5514665.1 hypothetical protein [Arenibacter sp. M-2]
MNLSYFFRNKLKLPYSIGKYVAYIPFAFRPGIGRSYRRARRDISLFEKSHSKVQKLFILDKMKLITSYAYENIPFYNNYYKSKGFHPNQLISFEDIQLIPTITKKHLQEVPLEERTNLALKSMKVNTGGTSGEPLSFYTPPEKMGIEWAHLHYIWKNQFSFKPSELKLLFIGRGEVKDYVEYDVIRHSLRLDVYSDFTLMSQRLNSKYLNTPIHYLHGYPSIIYEFAQYCKTDKMLLWKITKDLKGCILNSEYAYEKYRNFIEKTFRVKTFTFYGHSEGCIIAPEISKDMYKPLHSYGYTEVLSVNDEQNLIGTNYYNFVSPLIRYNTEDVIYDCTFENGLLTNFKLKEGRVGDKIIDKHLKQISLTALIFGRHHSLFDYCRHIQIKQKEPGKATVFYVPHTKFVNHFDLDELQLLFNVKDIYVDFCFKELQEPIRSKAGKVRLLVN